MQEENLIIIKTLDELKTLSDYIDNLAPDALIAIDTETTGLEKGDEIIGYSICADLSTSYYVITAYWDVTQNKLCYTECRDTAPAILKKLVGRRLVMVNGVFDCGMIEDNYKVELIQDLYYDVLIAGHLLNENRRNGLKDRGVELFGEDAVKEQRAMKDSVVKNGGLMTKANYELYKADADLIALYGAKDAILTLKVMYHDVPIMFECGLDKFFFEESMPLFRGPVYQLNRTGLAVDKEKLQKLRQELEAECMEAKAFILKEVDSHVKDKFPGTGKTNHFNIGSNTQLSWLLFFKLGNDFCTLTDGGRDMCKALQLKLPYSPKAKREFIGKVIQNKGRVWEAAKFNPKTGKMGRPKKVGDPWTYTACGKQALARYSGRYKWVAKLLEYKKAEKLLSTYVLGIQEKLRYGIIRPSFLEHGTRTGRLSSRAVNFQNLPRDDKRLKACIVARPGKVFVGADYEQIEPRVFASFSKDERLMGCFSSGQDFYSVVGAPVLGKTDCTLKKDGSPDSFAVKYKKFRDLAKVIALAIPYGTTAPQLSREIEIKAGLEVSLDEAQEIIDDYLTTYPSVHRLMLDSYETVKRTGVVYNLFGRPRHIPEALKIKAVYKNIAHAKLPGVARTLLNQAMNAPIQSTAASLLNRAMINFVNKNIPDARIILSVHDEIVVECLEKDAHTVSMELKDSMENTNTLEGVDLKTEPKIANNLADLK